MRARLLLLPSALAVCFFLPSAAPAQQPRAEFDPAKLQEIPKRMKKFVDDGDLAGVVTVVGSSKGVAGEEAVGLLRLEGSEPMPKDALFRIASMTKPITAIGIMMLADEGKLSVDDPVEKYLPEFRGQMLVAERTADAVTLKKPARPVRIRDLLTHTSGLAGQYPAGLADVYTKRNRTLSETTIAISQTPLQFEPGSKWSYCNPGIDTLGRVIEVVSGQSYEDFLQKRLFGPLQMTQTTFHPSPEQLKHLAVTYDKKDGKLTPAPNTLIDYKKDSKHPIPAGGLFSTGSDLAKLYAMMLNKGTRGNTRFLSEKAVEEMTKVQTGDLKAGFVDGMGFGYGWGVVREPKGVTAMLSPGSYGHGGAFGTQAWIDPKQDVFVILLIQRTGLPNADGSKMREEFQTLAVAALKK